LFRCSSNDIPAVSLCLPLTPGSNAPRSRAYVVQPGDTRPVGRAIRVPVVAKRAGPRFFKRTFVKPLEAVERKVTAFQFEGRVKANGKPATYAEVTAPGSRWTLLPASMAVLHDNKHGKPELKFVRSDGHEAVFDGDTLENVQDPRYMGTFNYVTPMGPSQVHGLGSALRFAVKNTGHFFAE
jgi:hypothetical protein